jgi:hypothetical protein
MVYHVKSWNESILFGVAERSIIDEMIAPFIVLGKDFLSDS